jgi:antirestriction protein ArdC
LHPLDSPKQRYLRGGNDDWVKCKPFQRYTCSIPHATSHTVISEIITARIVAELERGVVPWRRPWSAKLPVNLISQKEYRGLNVLTLGSQGYPSRFWLTFNQATKLGGRIRRGEHASPVIFWNIGEEREYTTRDG